MQAIETQTVRVRVGAEKIATVDASDYDAELEHVDSFGQVWKVRICDAKWYLDGRNVKYAMTTLYGDTRKVNVRMHALIAGRKPGMVVSHKDGDGLNNQRSNLFHKVTSTTGIAVGVTELTCEHCGKSFVLTRPEFRRFCSRKCGNSGAGRMNGTPLAERRLRSIWSGMKRRCSGKAVACSHIYFGRGIRVCDEWNESFQAFRDWSYNHGYSDSLTLDRINNNAGYCPENCRWATRSQQSSNQRSRGGTSPFKGVIYIKRKSKFVAFLKIRGRSTSLGYFKSGLSAALAYDDAALNVYGAFACLNFPERKAKVYQSTQC